ncbi:CPK1, partial [Symbiodinium sp. CCMP2456]
EDSPKLLALMAMVREGRLSKDAEALFEAHAKKQKDGEAFVGAEDLPKLAAALPSLGVRRAPKSVMTRREFQEFLFHYAVSQQSGTKTRSAQTVCGRYRSLDDFHVMTNLGEGATGRVLLAKAKKTEDRLALKVVHKAPYGEALSGEELEMLRNSIKSEVEHLQLLDHPHIIRLHGHFEDAEAWYLALQYCASGDLASVMEEYKEDDGLDSKCPRTGLIQMPLRFSLKVTYQVLSALSYMHGRGIMHLDLKGQNIMFHVAYKGTVLPGEVSGHPPPFMVMKDPHAMLVDFGTSRKTSAPSEGPVGTPAYMAPEAWDGKLTPKADIFGLGGVFFQLLAGKMAFQVPDCPDIAECYWQMEPTAPWNEVPYVAPQCQEVCDQMLRHDFNMRPDAKELLLHPIFSDLRGAAPEAAEQVPAMPKHYAELLANYGDRDVLQKCLRMKLAMDWSPNQMPSFQRLFLALGGASAGVSPARLSAALRPVVGDARAQRAAAAVADGSPPMLDWTEFVAALVDLGDPKAEAFLRRAFDVADSDGDGLLGLKELASMMHADEKKHALLLQEYMVALCGRDSPGAKIDWAAFSRHFRSAPGESGERAVEDQLAALPQKPSDLASLPGAGISLQKRAQTLLDQAMRSMEPGRA